MSDSIRKLAVIVFTDIVDFTRLSADNEPVALQLLDTQRSILKPIVERHHGKWLKEIGDGLLLSFNTSKDAVDCAIEIQHTAKNIGNLNLRIGIHQGEVIQQGEDIVGDDVNVASRIESFAAPGGVVLSDRVLPSLLRDPLYQTKSLGSPELKGVKQEVEIYSIVSHGLPEGINKDKKKVTSKRSLFGTRGLLIGLSALILVLTAYYYKSQFSFQKVNDLSIAVLPFANMSTDKDFEYFSDGTVSKITDKIDEEITELKEAVALKDPENIKDEMGDVLFSLVNLSRFLDINPEDALRMTISKFETRFAQVEKELKKRGKSLTDSTLEEMDEIWNAVKKKTRA